MRITSIKPVITNTSTIRYNKPLVFRAGIAGDTFIKKTLLFDKFKNFTIAEYRKLTKAEISDINKAIDESFWITHDKQKFYEHLNYHDLAATSIKNTLTGEFGAGNFVVIPIGRSLSSIGKCLGYKIGEDKVKPLPMSQAARFLYTECDQAELKILHRYLDSIGLSKNELQKSAKKFVFTDYCHSGASLLGVKRLFTSENIYDNLNNIEFISIHNLLSDVVPENTLEKIENALCSCQFKEYSLVKKCPFISCTQDAVIKPEDYTDNAKKFYFKLLDNEMKK